MYLGSQSRKLIALACICLKCARKNGSYMSAVLQVKMLSWVFAAIFVWKCEIVYTYLLGIYPLGPTRSGFYLVLIGLTPMG